jgi:hypothetical protein
MMNNQDLSGGTGSLSNQNKRQRRMNLVTPRDSYMDGPEAMNEMMERKRMRGSQFREMKMADYRDRFGLTFDEASEMNFADKEYRLAIKEGKMKGAFAGEGMSFPIASPEDVRRAWQSVGRSDQPTEKLQRNILRIAKKYNWTNGLPKAVRDRMKKGGSGLPEN